MNPFDAVIVIAFGGPQGPDDVRPFLANVLRGRRVAPDRVEEVAHHYELFGGVSPLTELTRRQADGLQRTLDDRGLPLRVYLGMRNWQPYLADTLARMARDGVRRAIGVIAAAHRSYSGCTQYRENVAAAQAALRAAALPRIDVTYVGDWHTAGGFVQANVDNIRAAIERLPAGVRADAEIVFTAHSIPASMAARYPYERQIRESSDRILERLAAAGDPRRGSVAYQSRSGRPEDPWLEPDICDYLRDAARRGVPAVVLCPVGFLCDHIEVLYDLDVEAAAVARELNLPFARAAAVNDDEGFIAALGDAVQATAERYATGRPLPIVAPV